MKPVKKYCVEWSKFRKFLNSKISYIFDKILVLFIICSTCDDNNDRVFKEEERIQTYTVLGLI